MFVYANLYVNFSKDVIPYVNDHGNLKQNLEKITDHHEIKQIIYSENTNLQSYQKDWSKIYEELENNIGNYTREQLVDHIKNLKIANNQILHNFILLLKVVEEHLHPELFTIAELGVRDLRELGIAFSPASNEILQRGIRIRNLLIKLRKEKEAVVDYEYRKSLALAELRKEAARQLLIIENAPKEISEDIIKFIERRRFDFNALIIEVKTTLTDDFIENPIGLIKSRNITQEKTYRLWSSGWLKMEIPTDRESFADAIENMSLWSSEIHKLITNLSDVNNLVNNKTYEEALEFFDKILESDQNNRYLWLVGKGAALSELGRYEEAIQYFDNALDVNPDSYWAWNNKGTALNILGRYKEAIQCIDKGIELMSKIKEKIPQTYRVTRKDILLKYSCWRYQKADKKINRKMYCFQVIVAAPSSVLDRIEYVTYRLPPAWPEPNREKKVIDRNRHFEFKELAYGRSMLYAHVKIKDQDEPISLSHPIILTEEGPRLL